MREALPTSALRLPITGPEQVACLLAGRRCRICGKPTGAGWRGICLAGIAGGVGLVLTRKLKQREEFKVLTWEQQEWLARGRLEH